MVRNKNYDLLLLEEMIEKIFFPLKSNLIQDFCCLGMFKKKNGQIVPHIVGF